MRILIVTLLLIITASWSFSNTIILKNGRRIKVERLSLEGNIVRCQILGGEVSFKINEIAEIEQSISQVSSRKTVKKGNYAEEEASESEARSIALEAFRHSSENPFSTLAREKVWQC